MVLVREAFLPGGRNVFGGFNIQKRVSSRISCPSEGTVHGPCPGHPDSDSGSRSAHRFHTSQPEPSRIRSGPKWRCGMVSAIVQKLPDADPVRAQSGITDCCTCCPKGRDVSEGQRAQFVMVKAVGGFEGTTAEFVAGQGHPTVGKGKRIMLIQLDFIRHGKNCSVTFHILYLLRRTLILNFICAKMKSLVKASRHVA